jgi:hypothetical protein
MDALGGATRAALCPRDAGLLNDAVWVEQAVLKDLRDHVVEHLSAVDETAPGCTSGYTRRWPITSTCSTFW